MIHINQLSICILRALIILATTANLSMHSAQQPKEFIRQVTNDMYLALEVYDVEGVRKALKTGIYSHEIDPDSYQNPVKLINGLLHESYKAPHTNKIRWHARYYDVLDLLFDETGLPVNKVINHYKSDGALQSSYTLLQVCLFEHWRRDIVLHEMPHEGIPRIEIAKELIRKGARLHCKDGFGNSALHRFVESLTLCYPKHLSSCVETTIEALKFAYPEEQPDSSAPDAFGDDIRKIDFTTGIFATLMTDDQSHFQSELRKLRRGDVSYLRQLHDLQQEANS